MFQKKVILSWLACMLLASTEAFVIRSPSYSLSSMTSSSLIPMSADDHGEPVNTDDQVEEDFVAKEQIDEEEEEEEEPQPEDPELVALKEEIAKLEAEVKEKRRQVEYTSEQADEYSQAGYARKVAEMENMRRARSMLNTSNRSTSTAALLTKFLPTMDKLNELREKYGEDSFGKQYNALPGTLMAGFSAMGVADFSVTVGEKMDAERMVAVAEEHSVELPAGTVIREVSSGLQLEGNVIRMAECVVSLGPESNSDEPAASAETTEDDAGEA
ncbi:hypothetical protein FisN_9Lh301 [Fistulifera solaris]|uniref:GrpE protein homolog n=1 Tax=Fistulifera solaris TaxID=1519565 RepID=A0A1Z5KL04_FISSO|nr:hypothetical protein FisN_9Lh301 [Fistulifera solaris]|eukprot:GAX26993.1 hypothetical protein FisN_9Lh301 [Fistulifera solaris]